MDPPPCVQNAMMTKDKKPFTYTPGGIDLSEVRSPRMQRRIERNANLGGVSDSAQQPSRPQNAGPLPPAALAAMRPQPQVQVFPGPPPPPPMSKNIPPPPPPPSCPLPTQKITTGDNQVLERPDMTKIIPDNPMALLRKTGGPTPRKSFVEQMYEEQQKSPPSPPQRTPELQSPRNPPLYERSGPVTPPAQQQRQTQPYQPATQQNQPPSSPQQYQPSTPPQNQYQQPPYQHQYQNSQSPQPQYQPVQNQQRSTAPTYQPTIIERQPSMGRKDQPQKSVSSSVGSLYIPPLSQQQSANQQKFYTPPTPPERETQVQSPGTPTLKEAPRPWQQKNLQQQQTVPPWAKRDDELREQACQSPPVLPSNRWQQPTPPSPPQQAQPVRNSSNQFAPRSPVAQQPSSKGMSSPNSSNSYPVHIEIRAVPYPAQEAEPAEKNPNAVYVTQPIVLQHPGPRMAPPHQGQPKLQQQAVNQNAYQQTRQVTQQQSKVDASGTRIIPIQIERTPPSTPGAEKSLNRQQSWGSQPTQSNSFKVIQKLTKTDDDEDDDTPITQHSARYPQEMSEQVRRIKINDNGHFKQGNGQSQPYVHPSEQTVPEPKKYMGGNIPSRSFKILQAMTAPSDGCANANYNEELPYNPMYHPYGYPYYPPPYWSEYYPNFYPQEQSEPSRCNDKSSSTKSGRSTPLFNGSTQCSSPYWGEYYSPFYPQQQSDSSSKMSDKGSTKSGRSTPLASNPPAPLPYWNDYYNHFYPQQQSDSSSKMSERSTSTKSGRSTPLPTAAPIPPPMPPPYWGFMPPPRIPPNAYPKPPNAPTRIENHLNPKSPKPADYQSNTSEESFQYPPYHMFPPYFDPYYYSYYYGYPPMMPPYPFYPSSTEQEECSGYSSQDEMSSYNNRRSSLKRRNSLENVSNSVQALKQHFEVRSKSATPRITITPSFSQEKLMVDSFIEKNKLNEDSETEIEEFSKPQKSEGLKSIKSVQNINVYASDESDTESSETEESSENESEEEEEEILEVQNGDDIIPHQLSVIYEESERGDSRRSFRPSSVASETTTIAEQQSEDDDEDFLASQNVKYKINMFQETSEQLNIKSMGGRSTKSKEHESESFASFTLRNNLYVQENRVEHPTSDYMRETNVRKEVYVGESACNKIISPLALKDHSDSRNLYQEEGCKGKGSVEDWWDDIQNSKASTESINSLSSIRNFDNKCDKVNFKAENVMMKEYEQETFSISNTSKSSSNDLDERICKDSTVTDYIEETQVVCVRLRNKNGRKEEISDNINDNSFFDTQSSNRSSVYDYLRDEDAEEEIESGGTLMKVGSFVSALEALKKSSGLWSYEEINFGNPPIIKEEEQENDGEIESKHDEANETDSKQCDIVEIVEEAEIEEKANESEESEIDFWSQIKGDDDDFQPRRPSHYFMETEDDDAVDNIETEDVNVMTQTAEEKESDSASSRHSSFSESQIQKTLEVNSEEDVKIHQENNENSEDSSAESESSEEEQINQKIFADEEKKRSSNSRSGSLEPQTIKERIEALKNSIAQKQKTLVDTDEINVSVKSKISAIEVPQESRSKTTSTKSSVKSFEEYSEEEEGDSGVISDVSRHISDNEEFPELKKLTRYERAATHSRLFKLLQDECDIEEEDDEVFAQPEDKFSRLSVRRNRSQNKLAPSKSKLSLALNKFNEETPVNEKLVDELVQSLLRSRKAQVFRNMPKEKLRAAARIILQEGIEGGCETPTEEFSSLLSPLRGDTESSTPAQTPQEFYSDNSEYKQYYESWNEASTDIMPSRAFKLLQEHFGASKLGTIENILAKCPKILSNKNISKEILKHLDELSSDYSSPYPKNPPQSNDVTNT